MTTFRCFLLLSCLAASIHAQDFKARLAIANTPDDIREFYSKFREFGVQHEATYTDGDTKLFVAWFQPKERATPTFLFVYIFRSGKWHLLVDHPETIKFADDAVAISIADRAIRLISPDGHVTKTYEMR